MTILRQTFQFLVLIIITGIVVIFPLRSVALIVLDQLQFKNCGNLSINERLNCQRSVIKNSVDQGNIATGISLFKEVIKNDDVDCHTLGHEVGFDVYQIMKVRGLSRIGDPLPYCGYGFWHGFMSGVTNDLDTGKKPLVDLSQVCQKMLGGRTDIYGECYHGFGLGFVGDPPSPETWGNPIAVVTKVKSQCTSLTSNPDWLDECLSGLFHQLLQYMETNQFKFSLPKGDAFYNFCNQFGTDSQKPCLEQQGPILATVTTSNVSDLINLINTKFGWVKGDLRLRFILTVVSGGTHLSSDEQTKKDIVTCFKMQKDEAKACFDGIFSGVIGRNNQGDVMSVNYLIEGCSQGVLDHTNQKICMNYLVGSSKNKVVTDEIKTFCRTNSSYPVCKLILPNL